MTPWNCAWWQHSISYKCAATLFHKNLILRMQLFNCGCYQKDNQQTVLRTKKNHPKDGRKNKTFIVLLYLTLGVFPITKTQPLDLHQPTFTGPIISQNRRDGEIKSTNKKTAPARYALQTRA